MLYYAVYAACLACVCYAMQDYNCGFFAVAIALCACYCVNVAIAMQLFLRSYRISPTVGSTLCHYFIAQYRQHTQ